MSRNKSIEEIQAGWLAYERPAVGATYQHYKGGLYVIVATGFMEDSETPAVIYRSQIEDIVWVRTAENFLETIEHEGVNCARFELVN